LSKENIEQVNRKYHDLKHHLYAIRTETDADARARYVDQLEESIKGYETSGLDTGNTVLDAVVTGKRNQAAQRNIELTCVADGAELDFVDVIDLCTLIGNALDNAIEATASLPDVERRLIRLAIFRQDGFAMLRVENYYDGELTYVDGVPSTTKADSRNHGYGLKNMRQATERYGGSLTIRAEDHWFTLRILLPIPATR
jgi:sensor histidine kinase regulating citrate/malate metabolism